MIELFCMVPRGGMRPTGKKVKGDRFQVVKGRTQLRRDSKGRLAGLWFLVTRVVQTQCGQSLAVMLETESRNRGAQGKG